MGELAPAPMGQQRRAFATMVLLVVVFLGLFGYLLSEFTSPETGHAASSAGLLLVGLIAIGSALWRRRQTRGRRRQTWTLLASAGAVAVSSNVLAAATGWDGVEPHAVVEVGIGSALVLAIVAMLRYPVARRRGIDAALMTLDGVVTAGCILVVASVLVFPQLAEGTATVGAGTRLATFAFPVLDLVLATVSVITLERATGRDRGVVGLLAAGFAIYTTTALMYAVLVVQGRFENGTILDLGWIAGYLAISLAAWLPNPRLDDARPPARTGSDARGIVLLLTMLLLAGGIQMAFRDEASPGLALLWLVIMCSFGFRQIILAVDNESLRRGLELRVRAQTADLRRLARETDALLTSVRDGIYGVDPDGNVTFVNPSAADALGRPGTELLGQHACATFHSDAEGGHPGGPEACYVVQAIRSGAVASSLEDVYSRDDGATFPVEVTASPLIENGESRGAVVAFRDVTQRREVERMKGEFLSMVSHELRTPLTSIRGSLGLLAGGALGELSPRATSMVSIAVQSSDRLTRLINDLLDLDRIGSGARPMEIAGVQAGDLVATAVGQIQGMAAPAGVEVAAGSCRGRVLADEDRVMQVLINLLGNAVKYSPPNGRVLVRSEERDGHVLFSVSDEGCGIPPDMLDTVFERFQQVDSSDTRRQEGTGLGLAISKGIVERHGGRIWAESELGRGTTVRFTIPAAPTAVRVPDAGPVDGPTVLVCDDDATVVDVFSTFLRRHGFRAVGVSNGADALARIRSRPVEAVVLDLHMPGCTGAEVLASMRGDESTARVPVVLVSANGPEVEPGLADEVDDWLVKPVSEERLVAAVSRALRKSRAAQVSATADGGGE